MRWVSGLHTMKVKIMCYRISGELHCTLGLLWQIIGLSLKMYPISPEEEAVCVYKRYGIRDVPGNFDVWLQMRYIAIESRCGWR